MNFVIIALIPVLIAGVAFFVFHTKITWKEVLLQVGASLLILIVSWQIAKWSGLRDTEILNGRITNKEHGTQSCCHCRQECNFRDSKGKCTSYRTVCDHFRDYYWSLNTNIGTIDIQRCSGWNSTPEAWANAYVGEPASRENSYNNYLLADPNSLFVHHEEIKESLPKYPNVYGYYKANHIISEGVDIPNGYQEALREINADLGSLNQVDVTLYLTKNRQAEYAQRIEAGWLYGPKNSVTIVAGIKEDVIDWVRVISYSKVEELKVRLRDDLQGNKFSDPKIFEIIRTDVSKYFKRTPMAEMEYLARAAEPRGVGLVIIIILQILFGVGLTYYMHANDVFNDEWKLKLEKQERMF